MISGVLIERVLTKFADIEPAMPISVARAFVWIARNQGRRQIELEHYLGSSNATASRCVTWWSEWQKPHRLKGFVTSYPDPTDRRFRVLRLTERGEEFWEEILSSLEGR